MSAEAKLAELGIVLPPAPAPAGLYVPAAQTGNLLFIAGQVPMKDGKVARQGKLGRDVSIEDAAALARICALQALAIVKKELGSLDRVSRVIRTAGFVASAEGFTDHPLVVNGASQVLIDIFGEAGKGARVAVGLAELPMGVPVEVEFLFETR